MAQITETDDRIAEWVKSSTDASDENLTPAQAFEQAVRDMRHAGYRLPGYVVAGVRAALNA